MIHGARTNRQPYNLPLNLVALLCAVVLGVTESRAEKQHSQALSGAGRLNRQTATASASCSLTNASLSASSTWLDAIAGDRVASFLNPDACAGAPDLPYSIQSVSFPLYSFAIGPDVSQWPVGINVQVWSLAGGDSCGGPGTLLFSRYVLCDSATFSAPNIGTVTLPSPVCVNGPFYVALEYAGTTPTPYPAVLFDNGAPGNTCNNWAARGQWYQWNDFWTPPVPGNFMIYVDGESNSGYCGTDETTIYSIESLHDNYQSLVGTRVSIVGYYTDTADAKIVSFYGDFLKDNPMPTKSEVFVVGPQPADSFNSAFSVATGYLQAEFDPNHLYPDDSMSLKLYVVKWTKILEPFPDPASSPALNQYDNFDAAGRVTACDPCKFAILISGGVDAANNHDRYWNNLAMLYKYKVTNGGYCPENVFVHYYQGTSKNTADIPQARVDSATSSRIKASHEEVARRAAACKRDGKAAEVQKLVTNHGAPDGICLLGNNLLKGDEFVAMQQPLIDSGVTTLHDELVECYGGKIADSLRKLNDRGKTTINVNSSAGDALNFSTEAYATFLKVKVDSLNAGVPYDEAVAAAAIEYGKFLDSLIRADSIWLAGARAWLAANPPTGTPQDTVRNRVIGDTLKVRQGLDQLGATRTTAGRSRIWVRIPFTEYCQWRKVVVPAGGQLCLEFDGTATSCGNVTVYEEQGGTKVKKAVWNWNNPNSPGYTPGNNRRYINAEDGSNTVFWIHNDNGAFSLTATSLTDRPNVPSPSNVANYGGWSLGGRDSTGIEFGNIVTPFMSVANVESPGIPLINVPRFLGAPNPVGLVIGHNIAVITPEHNDMEFWMPVSQVITPGPVQINVGGSTLPVGTINITAPGLYTFHCGAFTSPGTFQIQLNLASSPAHFEVDSYGLRSMVHDVVSCCSGLTGNVDCDPGNGVDIADLSALIDYLYITFTPLCCTEEANTDGQPGIDIADLSALIDYLYISFTPTAACQ